MAAPLHTKNNPHDWRGAASVAPRPRVPARVTGVYAVIRCNRGAAGNATAHGRAVASTVKQIVGKENDDD